MQTYLSQGPDMHTVLRPQYLHTAVPFSPAAVGVHIHRQSLASRPSLWLFQGQGIALVRAFPSSRICSLPTVIILFPGVSLLYSVRVLLVVSPLSLLLSSPDTYIGVRTYRYSIHRRNFLC